MNYPFWDVGIGYGILMAVISILHVFVSHFAIGGGLYLVVAESSARRKGDALRLEYLQRLSKFFVLATLVFGGLSGVGIWFIIGLLNPTATEALIHNFVWGWAIEWTFFIVEICAAMIYYYGWKKMSARTHLAVGWIYFAAAWLSLVVINGIVAFMLTPGKWISTGSFWDGFFNPTYWPSLTFRTGICVLLAGIYAMAVASRARPDEFRARVVKYNAGWSIAGMVLMIPSFYWYWRTIPVAITAKAVESMPTTLTSLALSVAFFAALAALVLLFGVLMPKRLHVGVALVLLALSLGFFGGFEWMRESIRKPFVIHGYMYGNAVELAKAETYKSEGYLPQIAFRTGDDGADLFRHACRSCHTLDGYKPLKPAFEGTDQDFIAAIVKGTGALKGNMPPFLGTDEEARLIAEHVWRRVDQRPMNEIFAGDGAELGKRVYGARCGRCHEVGGYNDKTASLAGLTEDEINSILDSGNDFAEEMPNFTGNDIERKALVGYIRTLGKAGDR